MSVDLERRHDLPITIDLTFPAVPCAGSCVHLSLALVLPVPSTLLPHLTANLTALQLGTRLQRTQTRTSAHSGSTGRPRSFGLDPARRAPAEVLSLSLTRDVLWLCVCSVECGRDGRVWDSRERRRVCKGHGSA